MSVPPPPSVSRSPSPRGSDRLRFWLVTAGLLGATFAVYFNSLSVPFFFDDRPAIERNESIRQLWPLTTVLTPPVSGAGAAGRPVTNLSLAINYAIGGLDPRGYHLANILLHALAGLTLWGVLRRTLSRTRLHGSAEPLAAACALLWLVHPLQTETVVSVVQRNEILVTLFYLLTLYALERTAGAPDQRRWPLLAFGTCVLGMASKEVMATAPVLALLYDRTFLSRSWAQVWRERGRVHAALAGTWLLLLWLVLRHEQRAGTVGFDLGVGTWHYLLTQCDALTTYLKLALWPHPLLIDYGVGVITRLPEVAGRATLILSLLGATALLLWRKPALGFAAAAFFIVLAPSSSFVPLTTQPIAEHRMYLPLAPILVGLVLGAHWLAPRFRPALLVALAVLFGLLTVRRNRDFASELRLWQDNLAKAPQNPRAHASLAGVFSRAGDWERALPYFEQAIRLRPDYADVHNDYGVALGKLGRHEQALTHHARAWQLKADDWQVRFNLGVALRQAGRPTEAKTHLEAVIAGIPQHAAALGQLGEISLQLGRPEEALRYFQRALALGPAAAAAQNNTAVALLALGRQTEAFLHYTEAVRLQPDNLDVRINYGDALLRAGQPAAAASQYAAAARLKPDSPEIHYNHGNILLQLEQFADAAAAFTRALHLRPDWVPAHHNLALVLTRLGRVAETVPHYEAILRQQPRSPLAHHNLALSLAAAGRSADALRREEEALRLQPDFAPSRRHLQQLRSR
jgi:tetratricopeptide (TPR) repeat protein